MKKKMIIVLLVLGVFMLTGCSAMNQKIQQKDILGKWTYNDHRYGKVIIDFKDNGDIVFNSSEMDREYTWKYKLSYGINNRTYITFECDESDENNFCWFAEFQDIDMIDGKLYFVGGTYHPGFERTN